MKCPTKNHLRKLFGLLSLHGVFINRKKCHFGLPEVQYLGHLVTAEGILPNQDCIAAIRNFPPPDTKVGLKRFLQMLNYYPALVSSTFRSPCQSRYLVFISESTSDIQHVSGLSLIPI